jgi:hypothetical protein
MISSSLEAAFTAVASCCSCCTNHALLQHVPNQLLALVQQAADCTATPAQLPYCILQPIYQLLLLCITSLLPPASPPCR